MFSLTHTHNKSNRPYMNWKAELEEENEFIKKWDNCVDLVSTRLGEIKRLP